MTAYHVDVRNDGTHTARGDHACLTRHAPRIADVLVRPWAYWFPAAWVEVDSSRLQCFPI
eukprot:9367186-Pyramimonas_sp.AAC.1